MRLSAVAPAASSAVPGAAQFSQEKANEAKLALLLPLGCTAVVHTSFVVAGVCDVLRRRLVCMRWLW